MAIVSVVVTPDGKTYVYTYSRVMSELYLLEGCQEWCSEGVGSALVSMLGG